MKLYAVRVGDWWLGTDAAVHGAQLVPGLKYERVLFQDRSYAIAQLRLIRVRWNDCTLVRIKQ